MPRLDKTSSRRGPAKRAATTAKLAKKRDALDGIPKQATLVRKFVLCGKCPRKHGPYWFAAWKVGGRTRWRYIGSDARAGEYLRRRGQPDRFPIDDFAKELREDWQTTGATRRRPA